MLMSIRILFLTSIILLTGCNSMSYYSQAIKGHLDLVSREQPIDVLLESEQTDPALKAKLRTALEARAFATAEIGLLDNDSYKTYADLQRPYAVWNVIAAPKYSVQADKWCYFIVGCLSYRGYFAKEEALRHADELKAQGKDVMVSGAAAYSTLGWMDDPLLNTIVNRSESSMIGIIFHELAHQVIYIDGDTAFNEAFAMAVEYEGLRRWYSSKNNVAAYDAYRNKKNQQAMIYQKLQAVRSELDIIYQQSLADDVKQQRKQAVFTELKLWYQQWRIEHSYDGFDNWMQQDLNNAHLVLIATYQELVPDFEAVLSSVKGNMQAYYDIIQSMRNLDNDTRYAQLKKYRMSQQASN